MDEKTMVNDILEGVKSELTTYQGVISETENIGLRQTIQEIRNNDESFQYELFKIAETKGYYKPAAKVTETEINNVEPEGDDLKVDISFDKVGHKRLMAKFANLELI